MRIVQFRGLIPKMAEKALPQGKATIAENLDLYGNHLKPIKTPVVTTERLLTPCGEPFTGVPVSVHRAGSVYVAWDALTYTAVDWTKKLGDTSFLFVQDGKLYRQSAERLLNKRCPIRVGIERPHNTKITAQVVTDAGCESTRIENLCVPTTDCDNIGHPPVAVAYLFTYVNGCGEESAHSAPSEVIDIKWGDAVQITVDDPNVPDNALYRRWYRAVPDTGGVTHWLKIADKPINATTVLDANCPCDFSCELMTENHDAPPECLQGVANIGNNMTVVWSNKHFWVSEENFPHAYNLINEYKLRYRIQGMYEITPRLEGNAHYSLVVITDGLHYTITTNQPTVIEISEIQQRYKCLSATTTCHGESEILYSSEQGIVSISQQGEQLITGELMTEYEWDKFSPRSVRLVYHDDRIFGFTKRGGFILQLGTDKRRDPEFVTHNIVADLGHTDETSRFTIFKDNRIYEWGKGDRANYDWKSAHIALNGIWRPVTCKVVSSEFDNIMPKGHKDAKIKYAEFRRKHPNATPDVFFDTHPEMTQHYAHLVGVRPSVTVIIYADGREYYRREVSTNKPFLLPRRYRAIDWAVRIIGNLSVDEIHLQGSRESLVGDN